MPRQPSRGGAIALAEIESLQPDTVKKSFPNAPPQRRKDEPKKRYSVTADILSFRRCARQYGFYVHRQFVPARAAQLYFGTVVHQVLNRIHSYYAGLENAPKGSLPDDTQVDDYVEQVDLSLRLQGIKPMSQKAKEQVIAYLQEFNSRWGEELYPRIVDTERRLERDQGNFILEGVVDVLARSFARVDADRARPGELEIWDYKGSRRPAARDLESYEFQMCVYARLYQLSTGVLPRRAVLWFLGEKARKDAEYEVTFTESKINEAMRVFTETVAQIQTCKAADTWASPPKDNLPDDDTCIACDVRWSCPARNYKLPTY